MEAKDFLEKNGFDVDSNGVFTNGLCEVRINEQDLYYVVGRNEFDLGEYGFMFSHDLNIYWLIGVLTYYGLIDKNYEK